MEIINRPKTSFDVGSGIRALVVSYLKKNGKSEREAAKEIWRELFGYDNTQNYFHSYPVFDSVIDRRGRAHRDKMKDRSIRKIESIILEKFEREPFYNLYLLNGIVPRTGKNGGICSDKTLSFLTHLRERGYSATLHSADIGGKKDIHRLVKLDIEGEFTFSQHQNAFGSIFLLSLMLPEKPSPRSLRTRKPTLVSAV